MKYQEFVYAVISELNLKLKGGKVSLHKTVKNNGKERSGALIEIPGINISPTIYLEEFYERFNTGKSMDEVVMEILDFYENVKCTESWEASWVFEYEKVREKIILKLINTKENVKFLEEVPHWDFLDLSVVFQVLLDMDSRGITTLPIDKTFMEKWGVTQEELYKNAMENTIRFFSPQFIPMKDMMAEFLQEEKESSVNLLDKADGDYPKDIMYVLTNQKRNFGAACILYPTVLEKIGEILEEDYFVLPSSIHEIVIVPGAQRQELDNMDEMVNEINIAEVSEEEILSSHAYFYDRQTKRLEMGQSIMDSV